MATLREVQGLIHRVVRGEAPLEDSARALGVRVDRLTLYRDFIEGHVTGILGKLYPTVRALLPAETWLALSLDFYREVPAASWELNACAAPFAAWLDGQVTAGRAGLHPFLVSLAQLEWEQFAVYVATEVVPDPATLDALALNPTVALLSLPYPVVPFMVAHDDVSLITTETPLPEPAPELAILFRRFGDRVVGFHQGGDDLLFALKTVHEGVPLEAAADAAHVSVERARAAIQRAIDIGLLLGPLP